MGTLSDNRAKGQKFTRPPLRPTDESEGDEAGEDDIFSEDDDSKPLTPQKSPRTKRKVIETPEKRKSPKSHGTPKIGNIQQQRSARGAPSSSCNTVVSPFFIVVIIILVLVALAYGAMCYNDTLVSYLRPAPLIKRDVFAIFEKDVSSTLPKKFPRQEAATWRLIKKVVNATLHAEEPRSPGVITIVAPNNSESIDDCLGRIIAEKLKSAYGDASFVHIQGPKFRKSKNPDEVKFEVDTQIMEGLQDGRHVVLLQSLQYIPAKSALLFHGLCDNENAPFKRAVFIFTMKSDHIAKNERDQEITEMWKDGLSDDQRYSLETRIGNNLVVIKSDPDWNPPTECLKTAEL